MQEKLDRVRSILAEHNLNVENKIDIDQFFSMLKIMGGTSESRLSSLSWEDISNILPTTEVNGRTIKPMLLAKDICKVFRTDAEPTPPRISLSRAKYMDTKELLRAYSQILKESQVLDPSNEVVKRLREISKDQKCIVRVNNEVDVETSYMLIVELSRGFKPRDTVMVSGSSYQVYKVGEVAEEYGAENPLYPGEALRPFDESCTHTGFVWKDVPLKTRQILRLAKQLGKLDKVDAVRLHEIVKLPLESCYPAAAAEYNQLALSGNLPSLNVRVTSTVTGTGLSAGTKVTFSTTKGV